jgi:hypothetical protein
VKPAFIALIVAVCALLGARPAVAQDHVDGTWVGKYFCAQGETALTLTIDPAQDGTLRARFHFYPAPKNPYVPEGCFTMTGKFDPVTRALVLSAGNWIVQPRGYVTMDLKGRLRDDGSVHGLVLGPGCALFTVYRDTSKATPGKEDICRGPVLASVETAQPQLAGTPR